MIAIDILSDTHNRRVMEDILGRLSAQRIIDRLLVTGDLTANGFDFEYLRMARWLAPWMKSDRLTALPGNHDAGLLGIFYEKKNLMRFDETFGTEFTGFNSPSVTEITTGGPPTVIIGLDSNRETWWPGDFARGRIGFYQLWRLSRLLKKYRNWVRIVALHHHPFYRDTFLALTDWIMLIEILSGNCDVLCFGHKHKSERFPDLERGYDIPLILASGASFREDSIWRLEISDVDSETKIAASKKRIA